MSRRRVLAAAGTGLSTGLAGCALGQSSPAGKTVVQLAATSAEKGIQGSINGALHDAGLPSDVVLEILPGDGDLAQSQFTQWLSAGLERPSLLRMDNGWTIPFIMRKQIANLSEKLPQVAQQVKSDYFQASVSTLTGPGGDIYGVPMFADFGLMLYRKDLVEKAGYDPSGWATNPISWKRFSNVVADTMEQTGTRYGFTFQAMVYEGLSCCTYPEFMSSWGGSYFGARKNLAGPVGERPVTVAAEPSLKANRMARTFIRGQDDPHSLEGFAGNVAPPAVSSWSENPSLSPFVEGDAVAHRNWPYSVLEAGADSAFGKDLGVMPIPYGVRPEQAKFDGMGGSVSALGGWHVTLNPNARHEEAALQVLKAMTSRRFNMVLLEELGYLPAKPSVLDSQAARNVDVVGRYVETLKFAGQHAIPRPVTVVWPLQSPRISQQVNASYTASKTPKEAMTDLAGLLEEIEQSAAETRNT